MLSKLGRLAVKFSTLILFLAVCYVALFFAYGYQYDTNKQDVKKTSIIDLIGSIREARVLLDGKFTSNFLPFQIKNVDPGNYELSVSKNGFLPWKRKISVAEDFVTIVNDILLVPSNLQQYTRVIDVFGAGTVLNFGKDVIFSFDAKAQTVHLLSLYHDGTFKSEELKFSIDDIKSVESLDEDRFIVTNAKGEASYLDFKNRKFLFFARPDKSYGYKVGSGGDRLYFFIGGSLFSLKIDELLSGSQETVLEKSLVAKNVDAVSFGFNGQAYFVSGGVAYRSNGDFTGKKPLNLSLNSYENLSFIAGRDFGYLVLRTKDQKRMFYLVDKKGRYKLLCDDIAGKPFINGFDQAVYSKKNGEVYYYDANIKDKVKVMTLVAPFEILGWFSDEGHFVYREKSAIRLGDVFNANVYDLIDGTGITAAFVFSKNIFYVKDNKVNALNWRSLL